MLVGGEGCRGPRTAVHRAQRRRPMDPRTPPELEGTGTLPIQGAAVPPSSDPAPEAGSEAPAWLAEARESITVPGKYLAYEDSGRHQVVPVQREWTRIGRSLAADVRF